MEALVEIPEPSSSFPSLGVSTEQGLLQWISSVDHKMIGIMYLFVSLFFFLIGGAEALLMRVQLALPINHFLGPETYNQIFTMHGTTMIFLVAMPAIFGFSVYFVPLMIGANEMAFPRLTPLVYGLHFLAACYCISVFWRVAHPTLAGSIMHRSTKKITPAALALTITPWVC